MQRYFVEDSNWLDGTITISGDDAHHMVRVMRYGIGEKIICNHSSGKSALCEIASLQDGNSITANIIEWLDSNTELPVSVEIIQALPKGNKLEFITQKGTELGAASFLFFQGDRSIVKWDKKKLPGRLERYRKIVKEASEQSHRNHLPTVDYIGDLVQFMKETSFTSDVIKLFAYEEEAKVNEATTLHSALVQVKPGSQIQLIIGPEGGFSPDEVELLHEYGYHSVRLGPRILRTETASLYALASISYHFEEMGCH